MAPQVVQPIIALAGEIIKLKIAILHRCPSSLLASYVRMPGAGVPEYGAGAPRTDGLCLPVEMRPGGGHDYGPPRPQGVQQGRV